jgi:predicted metal-dependent hydrolase
MKEEEYLGLADFCNWSQFEFQFSLQDFHFVPGTVVNSQKQNNLSSKTLPASTRDYEQTKIF